MVKLHAILPAVLCWAQARQPLWFRLGPEDRIRVVAALAALVILGFALVGFAWWAARVTRRYMNSPPRSDSASRVAVDDWADKPLHSEDDSLSPPKG
jgi:hypothetical protein